MAVEGFMEVTSGEGGMFRLEGAEEGTIGEGTLEEGTIRVDEEGTIGATKFVPFFLYYVIHYYVFVNFSN